MSGFACSTCTIPPMTDRMLRINEAVRQVLGEAVSELTDPRLGFVTITGVRVARDKRSAKVFYSVFGTEDEKRGTGQALQAAHGLLQRRVAAAVKLHSTPVLEFVFDDTVGEADRIGRLLGDEQIG